MTLYLVPEFRTLNFRVNQYRFSFALWMLELTRSSKMIGSCARVGVFYAANEYCFEPGYKKRDHVNRLKDDGTSGQYDDSLTSKVPSSTGD